VQYSKIIITFSSTSKLQAQRCGIISSYHVHMISLIPLYSWYSVYRKYSECMHAHTRAQACTCTHTKMRRNRRYFYWTYIHYRK